MTSPGIARSGRATCHEACATRTDPARIRSTDLRDLADALNDVKRFSSESATRGSYIPGLGTDTGGGTRVRAPSLAFLQ